MTTVYLHVGMPKCASSALQSFLHRNDALHRSEGLCYPASFREDGGYFSHRPLHKLEASEVAEAVDQIAREASAAHCNRILISSEEFVNSLWDRDITKVIIDALNARFGLENVRILILFRNPFHFAESVFAQFLKGGMFRTPQDSFLKSKNNDIYAFATEFNARNGFDFFSYSAFVEKLRLQAPANSFDLLSIEKADWQGSDILDVLCQRLQISRGEPRVLSNERYSDTTLHLLHHARKKYGFRRTLARRKFIAALFPNQDHQFSKLLHVHGALFDQIAASVERDRVFFDSQSPEHNSELFKIPEIYRRQRDQENELLVLPWQLHLAEQIVKREEMSKKIALKIKASMQRKADKAHSEAETKHQAI